MPILSKEGKKENENSFTNLESFDSKEHFPRMKNKHTKQNRRENKNNATSIDPPQGNAHGCK